MTQVNHIPWPGLAGLQRAWEAGHDVTEDSSSRQWIAGHGAPSGDGEPDQFYLDIDAGDVYLYGPSQADILLRTVNPLTASGSGCVMLPSDATEGDTAIVMLSSTTGDSGGIVEDSSIAVALALGWSRLTDPHAGNPTDITTFTKELTATDLAGHNGVALQTPFACEAGVYGVIACGNVDSIVLGMDSFLFGTFGQLPADSSLPIASDEYTSGAVPFVFQTLTWDFQVYPPVIAPLSETWTRVDLTPGGGFLGSSDWFTGLWQGSPIAMLVDLQSWQTIGQGYDRVSIGFLVSPWADGTYAWDNIGNIKGAAGSKGDKGDTGAAGSAGPVGPEGDSDIVFSHTAPSSPTMHEIWVQTKE